MLGRVSTDTIANGIANTYAFQREPEFYAFGMVRQGLRLCAALPHVEPVITRCDWACFPYARACKWRRQPACARLRR